jgi:23S rRNA-/tRNA-specific pseudouridylate synthase
MNVQSAVTVLHKDAWFLVLCKPSGLPTTSPSSETATLVDAARALDTDAPRLHPSSRLDAEVSGVVVFARTRDATEHLLAARRAAEYERGYLALAPKAPEPRQGEWRAAIAIDPRDPRKRVARAVPGADARPALTLYRTLEEAPLCALLWLEPQTGRTHQLRVHAAHAGIALLGDRAYRGANRLVRADGAVIAARRTMLHCARVSIPDPSRRGRRFCFEAEPPSDLRGLWEAASGRLLVLPSASEVPAEHDK